MKIVLLGIACLPIILFILSRFFVIVEICGESMKPTFQGGEYVIGRKVLRKDRCRLNEIYVYYSPSPTSQQRSIVVKRLIGVSNDSYFFEGDNPECSYDSRYYGYVDPSRVIAHIKEPKNKGK